MARKIVVKKQRIGNPQKAIITKPQRHWTRQNQELIQNAILKITENKTSIIIAHRLSTILNSDRILVMDSGCLVESGTHKELIKNDKGYYRNLYEIQFKKSQAKIVKHLS